MQRPNEVEKKWKPVVRKKAIGYAGVRNACRHNASAGEEKEKTRKVVLVSYFELRFVSLPRMISLLRPRTFSFTRPYSSTPEARKPVRQRFQSSSNMYFNLNNLFVSHFLYFCPKKWPKLQLYIFILIFGTKIQIFFLCKMRLCNIFNRCSN